MIIKTLYKLLYSVTGNTLDLESRISSSNLGRAANKFKIIKGDIWKKNKY